MTPSQACDPYVRPPARYPRTEALVCPSCHAVLDDEGAVGLCCDGCARHYPRVAGLHDLRLAGDRYLDLDSERAKAERLNALESGTDVFGLSSAYYAMTEDVLDHRRERFLRHIAGAEARGASLASRLPRAGRILEVGCGTGGLLVAAARSGRAVVGIDIASRWLVVARRRLADHGLSVPLFVAEAERLPWPDASFDAVVADSVLEHLDDTSAALREWRRVLRPGGRLVAWSPNRFTLTTDPHVGLWGVGWLPRRWVPSYLNIRGRSDWPPQTLSAIEARRRAVELGWKSVEVSAPPVSQEWARTRPAIERLPHRVYELARRLPFTRTIIRSFGPLWELQAEAPR